MADPLRLRDDSSTSPLGRAVLDAASHDGLAAGDRTAIARRLGIAAGLASVAGAGDAAVVASSAVWWKVVVVAIALGGAVTIGITRHERAAPPQIEAPRPSQLAPIAPAAAIAPAVLVPAPVERPAVIPAPPVTHRPSPARSVPAANIATPRTDATPVVAPAIVPPAIEPAPTVVEPPPIVAEPTPPAAPAVDARRLAAEVALLDRARAALHGGDATGAIAALDEHHRMFADGLLLAEADLVRIEALLVLHRTAEATQLGTTFLARFPHSPLAKRVRSLISRPQ